MSVFSHVFFFKGKCSINIRLLKPPSVSIYKDIGYLFSSVIFPNSSSPSPAERRGVYCSLEQLLLSEVSDARPLPTIILSLLKALESSDIHYIRNYQPPTSLFYSKSSHIKKRNLFHACNMKYAYQLHI